MMNNKIVVSLLCAGLLTACTSKQLYESGQNFKKNECIKNAVTESDHRACLNAEKQSFEDYEKERKSVTEK